MKTTITENALDNLVHVANDYLKLHEINISDERLSDLNDEISAFLTENCALSISQEDAETAQCERYFMCEITEINGEYEYPSKFLMKCEADQDPDSKLDKIFVTYRGEGDKESDDFVWYDDGTAAKDPEYNEINLLEFNVMKEYLTIL